MTTRRCPDCGVTTTEMRVQTGDGFGLHLVTDEPKKGLLGGLGMRETLRLRAFVCPECGLVRSYAARDE
ncbi:hypothetical protein [Halogeometricum limi]|uniref:Nucleic-acid-binding protein containing Zn-ribbon domain n=1 Tax=Halogeometricum limi TaxID=555875 RepID=A0A1I6FT98_9EURY|nr:hypothetical protein [Halogeometricum limi]SFR33175.1 hypothetical protein SAMN04488124_0254 [Halogeometricum limi]